MFKGTFFNSFIKAFEGLTGSFNDGCKIYFLFISIFIQAQISLSQQRNWLQTRTLDENIGVLCKQKVNVYWTLWPPEGSIGSFRLVLKPKNHQFT